VKPKAVLVRPAHITGKAADEWDRAIAAMPPGFYTAADAPVLTQYVEALTYCRNAQAIVAKEGMTAKGSQGQPVAHPQLAVIARFADLMLKCAAQLGMSPAARTRLTAPEDDQQDETEARYFGGRQA